jgi:hypothetical protein
MSQLKRVDAAGARERFDGKSTGAKSRATIIGCMAFIYLQRLTSSFLPIARSATGQ